MLLERGANVEAKDEVTFPLFSAYFSGAVLVSRADLAFYHVLRIFLQLIND
jgi:hypothetical protein